MNKKTQMWIGVAAVAGIALFFYNKNKFANASGRASRKATTMIGTLPTCDPKTDNCSGAAGNVCGDSCFDGKCNVPVYDDKGKIIYYIINQPCPKGKY